MVRLAFVSFCVAIFAASSVAHGQALRLSGSFEYRTDEVILGEQVCFYPDVESARLISREKTDARMAWFCFIDTLTAKRMLRIPKPLAGSCGYRGDAVVDVYGYRVTTVEGDDNDLALLKRVVKLHKSGPLKCDP